MLLIEEAEKKSRFKALKIVFKLSYRIKALIMRF